MNTERKPDEDNHPEPWFVYMLECSDGSLYTGISNDVKARVDKHNSGKGAKYTRARLPVTLKAYWEFEEKSVASKMEYVLKQLSRTQKLHLLNGGELPQIPSAKRISFS